MYSTGMIQRIQSNAFFNRFSVVFRSYRTIAEFDMEYTNQLGFFNTPSIRKIPTYRYLKNQSLHHSPSSKKFDIDSGELLKMYKSMLSLNTMDTILYESQRQGRISFYMTNFGEEAVQIGSAAALAPSDVIFAQYRESGILLWRGYQFEDFLNQCYGNADDKNKGRQMPVHYGSKELNFFTISSPLTTQLPQAVGAAYGLKSSKQDRCVVCYFGEGAASEGDAHAAFNFASTLGSPVIFICRNNGYAISTPAHQQFNSDGIASKGPAYGINTIRVDGNDIIAMYNATKFAREYVVEHKKPALIEAMTYRIGHHSTSDDSSAYRSNNEITDHQDESPVLRLRKYLERLGHWSMEEENSFIRETRKSIVDAMSKAEKQGKPSLESLFSDVYSSTPIHIREQMGLMEQQVRKS